ncbi:MAG: hypothetical protein OXH93_13490 [Caldilineaceae bacterium]|nr:hypothetical protein [Caldilineaceae bacterium]
MSEQIYKATKTRSNRPGWSVTFRHPRRRDARGKYGLKVRRGLNTTDDVEADRLVAQLNSLLADPTWWSLDRRMEAERTFAEPAVSAFFDGIEVGVMNSKNLRDKVFPLPTPDEGYARVMLVGVTGAGKTTLLRHLIGSDHRRDRFPSTSTAKTTTADIEIIMKTGPFKAAITFMTEHETRCAIDECLEEACTAAIQDLQHDDSKIAEALLEHREQRFRLSYILGGWPQNQPDPEEDESDYQFDTDFDSTDEDSLAPDEAVSDAERAANAKLLDEYVARVRNIAAEGRNRMKAERGDFQDMENANRRQAWLDEFADLLYEVEGFGQLSLDIIESIKERFKAVTVGEFERVADWPIIWRCEEKDRDTFLKQVRWFSSNHYRQFGRLLTPLVNGIRVSGAFYPVTALREDDQRLVLLDGEGLGHSAKEATSVSTKVTEKFPDVEMILLVDTAQSPMQAAPMELLRSVGSSGHGHKLAVAFTHFDQVKGDALRTHEQKRAHVRASIGNAIGNLRESLGAPVSETLVQKLENYDFYLGGLDKSTRQIPRGFVKEMKRMLEVMQESAQLPELPEAAPIYHIAKLALPLRDATDGFKNPWWGRLGLSYYEGFAKEHWARIKALCRRIAFQFDNCEYSGLRPVADLVRELQHSISLWLDHPDGWIRHPVDESEKQAAIDGIRRQVSERIHILANRRLIVDPSNGWEEAFALRGRGSSYDRANRMARIYETAAPTVTSVMDMPEHQFMDEVYQIVRDAVEEAEGSVQGIPERDNALAP